jgi:hypothetical protein
VLPSTPPASVVMAPTHMSADTLEGYTSSSGCHGVIPERGSAENVRESARQPER